MTRLLSNVPTANHHVLQKLPSLSLPRRLLVEFADDPRYLLMSKDVVLEAKCYTVDAIGSPQKMILLQV